jgi:hypothetical protein
MKGRLAMNVRYRILTLGIVALSIVGSALAQDAEQAVPCNELPASVMAAFAKAYPSATIKECAKEVEGCRGNHCRFRHANASAASIQQEVSEKRNRPNGKTNAWLISKLRVSDKR